MKLSAVSYQQSAIHDEQRSLAGVDAAGMLIAGLEVSRNW